MQEQSSTSNKVPDDLKCTLTGVLMKDPVIASDGYCYDRQYIQKWIQLINVSPKKGTFMPQKNHFQANYLKPKILKFKQQHPEIYAQAQKQEVNWDSIFKRKAAHVFQINSGQKNSGQSQNYQQLLEKYDQLLKENKKIQNLHKQNMDEELHQANIRHHLTETVRKTNQELEVLKQNNKKLEQKYNIMEIRFKKSRQKLLQFYTIFQKFSKDKFLQELKEIQSNIGQEKNLDMEQQESQYEFNPNSSIEQKNRPQHLLLHDNGMVEDNSGKQRHQIAVKFFEQKIIQFEKQLQKAKQDKNEWKMIKKFSSCFEGQMKDEKMHGYGKLVQNDGNQQYQGQFKQGRFQGFGRKVDKNSGNYTGDFKDGMYEGFGRFEHTKGKFVGSVYVGQFSKGQCQGYGIFYYGENVGKGKIYQGFWKKGKQHGYGKLLFPGDTYYFGNFVKGKKHGQVNYVNKKNRIEKKYFERGVMRSLTIMRQKKLFQQIKNPIKKSQQIKQQIAVKEALKLEFQQ